MTSTPTAEGRISRLKQFIYLPQSAWTLTSTSALWSIGTAMASPYQTLYFEEIGASPILIGLLLAYGTAVTVLALLVGGHIADTWGRRRIIIVFSWVSVASAAVYALVNAPYLIVIPLTMASAASVYTPAFNSVLFDEIKPNDRIRAFSVFSAINTIPSIFAPTFGALLMDQYGILYGVKYAYLASVLFGAIGVSFRTKTLSETYVPKKKLSQVDEAGVSKKKNFFSYMKESFVSGIDATRNADSLVKKLLLYVTLAGIGTGLTSPYASIYVVNNLGFNPIAYSLVADLGGLTTVVLLFLVVFLVKRMGAKNGVLVASVSAPIANVIFSQAKTMDELLEWGVTGAVGTAIQSTSLSTMQADAIEEEHRGKILAMFSLFPALVSLPCQIIAGIMYSSIAPVSPFVAAVVPFSLGAFVLFSIKTEKK